MRVKMSIVLDRSDVAPLHRQVHEQVRRHILSGRLRAGDRLPGSRRLAVELGVSRTVVSSAYDLLLADGFVNPQQGSGTVVAAVVGEPARVSDVTQRTDSPVAGGDTFTTSWRDLDVDFRPGVPAWHLFPKRMWARRVADVITHARARDVGYGPAEGVGEFRRALVDHLRNTRGVAFTPECVIITAGATQAIDLVGRAVLQPGDAVIVEDPAHPVLRKIFENAASTIVPVGVDDDGMLVSQIPQALHKAGVPAEAVKLAYVTPSHQFPTGVPMSLSRRLQLLEWCGANSAWIVEDDYDSEFVLQQTPSALAGLDVTRTIYVGTFSKSLFPSLRIGFAGLPESLVAPVLEQKWLADRLSPTIDQLVLADLLVTGRYQRHVSMLRSSYAERRTLLLQELDRFFGAGARVLGPAAGLHALVELDFPLVTDELVAVCADRGVGIYGVGSFYVADPPTVPTLVLGYAAMPRDQMVTGLRVVADEARRLVSGQVRPGRNDPIGSVEPLRR